MFCVSLMIILMTNNKWSGKHGPFVILPAKVLPQSNFISGISGEIVTATHFLETVASSTACLWFSTHEHVELRKFFAANLIAPWKPLWMIV